MEKHSLIAIPGMPSPVSLMLAWEDPKEDLGSMLVRAGANPATVEEVEAADPNLNWEEIVDDLDSQWQGAEFLEEMSLKEAQRTLASAIIQNLPLNLQKD